MCVCVCADTELLNPNPLARITLLIIVEGGGGDHHPPPKLTLHYLSSPKYLPSGNELKGNACMKDFKRLDTHTHTHICTQIKAILNTLYALIEHEQNVGFKLQGIH